MSTRRNMHYSLAERLLKVAFEDLVEASGGQKGAAAVLGIGQQRVSDLGNINTDTWPRLDQIFALLRVSGDASLPRALAAVVDHFLVKKPLDDLTLGSADLHASIARYAKEHGEAMGRTISALGDGKVSPDEAPAVIAELDDAIEAAVTLRALLNHIAGER